MDTNYQNHATNYLVAKSIVLTIGPQNILIEHDDLAVIAVTEIDLQRLAVKDGVYQPTMPLKAISIIRSAYVDETARTVTGSLAGLFSDGERINLRIVIVIVPTLLDGGMIDYQVFSAQVSVLEGDTKGAHIWIRDVELGFVRHYAGI